MITRSCRLAVSGQPATHRTVAYLSHDDKDLFVVFVCFEKRGKIRTGAYAGNRHSEKDTVEILVDINEDRPRTYAFASSPLGTKDSQVFIDHQSAGPVDSPWEADSRITGDGFVVKMTVPFATLNSKIFDPSFLGVWGLRLRRHVAHSHEYDAWPAGDRR